MTNLAAAFEGTSQGLDELAGHAASREMEEAQAMRAENLAQLNNYLTAHRQLLVAGIRSQANEDRDQKRIAAESTARRGDIALQEQLRGHNQAVAQHRQLVNAEHLQDSAFVNQNELRARAAGPAGRVQAARDAAVLANKARQQKAQIRDWLTKYQSQSHGPGTLAGDPLDSQRLAQLARHDAVLRSQL